MGTELRVSPRMSLKEGAASGTLDRLGLVTHVRKLETPSELPVACCGEWLARPRFARRGVENSHRLFILGSVEEAGSTRPSH